MTEFKAMLIPIGNSMYRGLDKIDNNSEYAASVHRARSEGFVPHGILYLNKPEEAMLMVTPGRFPEDFSPFDNDSKYYIGNLIKTKA